ncbi:MAG: ribonuclease HII [Trueperaceae bacterium]|nr:MAG: ribonuclease HII [Trueperaceae bacterium]
MKRKSRSARPEPGWELEESLWRRGYSPVVGIDEVGRGALAGPVIVAAVVLSYGDYSYADSKTLKPSLREQLALHVREHALAWAVGSASASEIDRYNVLVATHMAASRALYELPIPYQALVTDYLRLEATCPVVAVPKADSRSRQVAAASILAKVTRDEHMVEMAADYPEYGFEKHKGYGSVEHLKALHRIGACHLHRRSFRPVVQRRLFEPS